MSAPDNSEFYYDIVRFEVSKFNEVPSAPVEKIGDLPQSIARSIETVYKKQGIPLEDVEITSSGLLDSWEGYYEVRSRARLC